ncbi:hypothetical protein N7509_012434 [Penicillium cosmopolitanum]|uniref:Uncharacterized protein n=1 Tax=Penicillium cosmopolitanum TaxID=1131564 RepID=A0A9W9VH67_9EURO|nr:uncharacterized protein N7509_012434 [Penicillium cosmopolitanum]KAJ5379315.1 hypothetical protein N7509_012434 [Penicillium cosmopolitanum]
MSADGTPGSCSQTFSPMDQGYTAHHAASTEQTNAQNEVNFPWNSFVQSMSVCYGSNPSLWPAIGIAEMLAIANGNDFPRLNWLAALETEIPPLHVPHGSPEMRSNFQQSAQENSSLPTPAVDMNTPNVGFFFLIVSCFQS